MVIQLLALVANGLANRVFMDGHMSMPTPGAIGALVGLTLAAVLLSLRFYWLSRTATEPATNRQTPD